MRAARRPILPWLVWGSAVLAYVVAIVDRSSLAALGPAAQQHFGIDATTLSFFAVIQLIVYAAMQIPVGTLLDRFGSTALILVGGLLMMLGQLAMATVHEVSLAILARILVGAGDACTFISVIRMIPEWFSVRQLPTVIQITGLIGQAGQLVSVIPLAFAVGVFGWTSGFVGVAAVGLMVVLFGAFSLRDSPGTGTAVERMTGRLGRRSREARSLGASDSTTQLLAVAPPATSMIEMPKSNRLGFRTWSDVRRVLSVPGVRLAYWVHFTSPFAMNVFVLLWGTPFLVGGVGLSPAAASSLLSLTIVSGMVAGVVLGPLTSRFVERRVRINVAITLAIVLVWCAVLLWPGTPPVWLLVVLMIVMPIGGPASMISFDVGRSHTPRSLAGLGTGVVNTAGFTATLLAILFIGIVLDLQGAGSPENYSFTAFRWAFAVQLPLWGLGIAMILLHESRTWRWMRERGRKLR